jgi:hypothetical protein
MRSNARSKPMGITGPRLAPQSHALGVDDSPKAASPKQTIGHCKQETATMSKSVIIIWLIIGALQATAIGAVAHVVRTDPGQRVVAAHGVVISPSRN